MLEDFFVCLDWFCVFCFFFNSEQLITQTSSFPKRAVFSEFQSCQIKTNCGRDVL